MKKIDSIFADTLTLTQQLIRQHSITPADANCQNILLERLVKLGFIAEKMPFTDEYGTVENLWLKKPGNGPCFVFAGHTDVVPTGDISSWTQPPFEANIIDGVLYGRGAADMKCSLAAFVTSIEAFLQLYPQHNGAIALLITSDEEGPATCGTKKVIQVLQEREETIDYCLVGEPSSENTLGDTIKIGRRGSLGAILTVIGKQGHIAYPQLADNPIHYCGEIINVLTRLKWDEGNQDFPATQLQISNINAGTGASNVIPATAEIQFNLRYSPELTADFIQKTITDRLAVLNINYKIDWKLNGEPFITPKSELVHACTTAIHSITGINTQSSTAGGTSDGRFIAKTGAQIVELGPINASIHQIDEHVCIKTPATLAKIYFTILTSLLT